MPDIHVSRELFDTWKTTVQTLHEALSGITDPPNTDLGEMRSHVDGVNADWAVNLSDAESDGEDLTEYIDDAYTRFKVADR